MATQSPRPRLIQKLNIAFPRLNRAGLPDASVSLITVAQALHWFDLERFFTEAKRVLEPGGVLAVWAYGINQVEGEAVNQFVQEYYSSTVGPYWPPERTLVEDGYRSIPFPFDETACAQFSDGSAMDNGTIDRLF